MHSVASGGGGRGAANSKGTGGVQREAAGEGAAEAGAQVDNLNAGGFFARFGREPNAPRPTVIPPTQPAEAMEVDCD